MDSAPPLQQCKYCDQPCTILADFYNADGLDNSVTDLVQTAIEQQDHILFQKLCLHLRSMRDNDDDHEISIEDEADTIMMMIMPGDADFHYVETFWNAGLDPAVCFEFCMSYEREDDLFSLAKKVHRDNYDILHHDTYPGLIYELGQINRRWNFRADQMIKSVHLRMCQEFDLDYPEDLYAVEAMIDQ